MLAPLLIWPGGLLGSGGALRKWYRTQNGTEHKPSQVMCYRMHRALLQIKYLQCETKKRIWCQFNTLQSRPKKLYRKPFNLPHHLQFLKSMHEWLWIETPTQGDKESWVEKKKKEERLKERKRKANTTMLNYKLLKNYLRKKAHTYTPKLTQMQ